jgi:hypothetical protein
MSDFAQIRFQPNRPLLRELSADRLNTILQEIKRNKPKGERGITVRQDGTGTYIGLAASLPRGGTSAPTTRQPWDLIARVDPDADPEDENPPYFVRVQPGTLNGILPSNWDEQFTCAGTGLHYAKAVIATDGVNITGLTIEIDTEEPPLQSALLFSVDDPVTLLFGLFAEGQVYRVIGPGDIIATPELWLTKAKDSPPAVGELPWINYYRLT